MTRFGSSGNGSSLSSQCVARVVLLSCAAAGAFGCGQAVSQMVPADGRGANREIRHGQDDGDEFTDHGWFGSPRWISFEEAVSPDRPDLEMKRVVPDLLLREIFNAIENESYKEAVNTAKLLVEVAPFRPGAHYNLACAYSLAGQVDDAMGAMNAAIKYGWRNLPHIKNDSDLDNLRADPRFAAVIAQIEAMIEAERIVPAPLRAESWSDIQPILETRIPQLMERYQVPGISIAVVRDGVTVWNDGFGRTDDRTTQAVSLQTAFRAEPPARLLMVLLAMAYEGNGNWRLDDPVSTWLGGSPVFADADESVRNVSIRQVLSFSSGLTFRGNAFGGDWTADEEIARTLRFNEQRLGKKYSVSPASYMLVGRAIEKMINQRETPDPDAEVIDYAPCGELLNGAVLNPLGMRRTRFNPPGQADTARGHSEYGSVYKLIVEPKRPYMPVYTTSGDLARLIEYLSGNVYVRSGLLAGLSPNKLDEIYEPGLPPALVARDMDFGLGVKVIETPWGRCAELANSEFGTGVLMRWYPNEKCGVVVLFNSDTGMDCARRIAHEALGGI